MLDITEWSQQVNQVVPVPPSWVRGVSEELTSDARMSWGCSPMLPPFLWQRHVFAGERFRG